jgi:hypothetical protein
MDINLTGPIATQIVEHFAENSEQPWYYSTYGTALIAGVFAIIGSILTTGGTLLSDHRKNKESEKQQKWNAFTKLTGQKHMLAQRYQAYYETIMQIIINDDIIRRYRLELEVRTPPDENKKSLLTFLYTKNNALRQRMNELQIQLGKDTADLWEVISTIKILFPRIDKDNMDIFTHVENKDEILDNFLNRMKAHPQWKSQKEIDDWRQDKETEIKSEIKRAVEVPIDAIIAYLHEKVKY